MRKVSPKRGIQRLLHAAGVDVHRWNGQPPHTLPALLQLYEVETVFDVGANRGSFGEYLRNLGFSGDIVSFEPVKEQFARLSERARGDKRWHCVNAALGHADQDLVIHVSGAGGAASSFLPATDQLTTREPSLQTVRDERVAVMTIDSVVERYYPRGNRLFLKLDVQGYESQVLDGARRTLPRIVGMRIEVSLVGNYEQEPLMWEMLPHLYGLGYRLTCMEHAWSNPSTQELYQLDATLFRTESAGRDARRD